MSETMSAEALDEKVKEIMAEELAIETDDIVPDLAYGDAAEWDSIAHVHLVEALEETFEITFDDDEIAVLSPYSKLFAVVAGKLNVAA